jgi:ubiquinone/menaquinone biosynthesis C-methylase UbiE
VVVYWDMSFRNILLTVSLFIIGLSSSLYFQTDQQLLTINFDQYKDLQYNEERSHCLEDFNLKLAPYKLQMIIQEIFEKNKLAGEKTRIMEIGIGNGRLLMELKKMFPEVEFYGINKEKTHTFYRRESYILTALKFGIFNKEEVEQIELPYVIFQDLDFARSIPYGNNKFDLVYSQFTMPYIKYKFEVFNEIHRVLKPNGVSFHSEISNFNLYFKGIVLDLRDALGEIRKRGLDIKALGNNMSIQFKKSQDHFLFPVTPNQPIPEDMNNLSQELRKPDMGYNII